MKQYLVTDQDFADISAMMEKIQNELLESNGSKIHPEDVKNGLQQIWDGKEFVGEKVLRLLSLGKEISIPSCDGVRRFETMPWDYRSTSSKSDRVFRSTREVLVDIYEVSKKTSFQSAFTSLTKNAERLCFSEDQIISFCENHKAWITTRYHGLYFLMQTQRSSIPYGTFGVFDLAGVHLEKDEIKIYADASHRNDNWSPEKCDRIVVPRYF